MTSVAIITLGCPKNVADSEAALGLLRERGFSIADEPARADVLVINTCGFLKDSETEALEMIDQAIQLKEQGLVRKIVVGGCLVQRWPERIYDQMAQVDAVVGVPDFLRLPDVIGRLMRSERRLRQVSDVDEVYLETGLRQQITPSHYSYLKISEGCNHRCRFCVIPQIKGRLRSRAPAAILAEAERMIADGVKEINVVAQDTTEYLKDKGIEDGLADLLDDICRIEGDFWVRVLYTYPYHWTERLIKTFAGQPKICKYIDVPIQHINDRILAEMGREDRRADIERLLERMRREITGVTIRTSIIVGFPGETEREFEELLEFMRRARFDRLGAFIFSPEEGTLAAKLQQQAPAKVKQARFDRLMQLQQEISLQNNSAMLGKKVRVLLEEELEDSDFRYAGRTQSDAPEVDGLIYLNGPEAVPGRFYEANVYGYMEYDLVGDLVE